MNLGDAQKALAEAEADSDWRVVKSAREALAKAEFEAAREAKRLADEHSAEATAKRLAAQAERERLEERCSLRAWEQRCWENGLAELVGLHQQMLDVVERLSQITRDQRVGVERSRKLAVALDLPDPKGPWWAQPLATSDLVDLIRQVVAVSTTVKRPNLYGGDSRDLAEMFKLPPSVAPALEDRVRALLSKERTA